MKLGYRNPYDASESDCESINILFDPEYYDPELVYRVRRTLPKLRRSAIWRATGNERKADQSEDGMCSYLKGVIHPDDFNFLAANIVAQERLDRPLWSIRPEPASLDSRRLH